MPFQAQKTPTIRAQLALLRRTLLLTHPQEPTRELSPDAFSRTFRRSPLPGRAVSDMKRITSLYLLLSSIERSDCRRVALRQE